MRFKNKKQQAAVMAKYNKGRTSKVNINNSPGGIAAQRQVRELDEEFQVTVGKDDTDGDYRLYKSANKDYLFYDDLSDTQKEIMVKHNLKFDLIGRIYDEDHDRLISRVKFKELK
jgi:hypothetical protein